MKNRLTLIFLFAIVFPLSAQKIFWSNITQEDVVEAIESCQLFFDHLKNRRAIELERDVGIDSLFAGKGGWIPKDLFLEGLMEGTEDISFQQFKFSGFQFDDFLDRYDGNEILSKIYPVFNNHCVLVKIEYQSGRSWGEVIMVMRNIGDHWAVIGFQGLGFEPEIQSDRAAVEEAYRIEKIPEAGIQFPVPIDFSKADKSDNQINFYLENITNRDAVFQILIDELSAKVYYYTYKFVEFSNQQYDLSDLTVRYLPYGILFEYQVTDSYGNKNKGITVGMKSNDQLIVIQFYAFYDIYMHRKAEIDRVFTLIDR